MQRHTKTVILALFAAFLVTVAGYSAQTPAAAPATAPAAAAKPADPKAAPKPKAVAVEPVADLGSVPKGEKITHDFVIKNEGDADLMITNVQPACGCTVADPATPKIDLTLRAKVDPYISAKPGYARYIVVQGESQEGTITQGLWAPDGSSWDITGVDSPFPYLKVTYREAKPEERVPDAKGKQWEVEMKLSNDAQVGPLADNVTVHTNHPKQKIVLIPVSGFVRPVMAVTPPVADFGKIELKEPLRKSLSIRNFATESIKVTSVEPSLKGIEVKLEPLTEGREYQVRVTLSPELGKGPFQGKLTFHTDSPKVPTLSVDIKGVIL